jgi:hypothetical protein
LCLFARPAWVCARLSGAQQNTHNTTTTQTPLHHNNRRVAKATGASVVLTLADADGGEAFDPACLGSADEVVEERIADDAVVVVKGAKAGRAATLLLVRVFWRRLGCEGGWGGVVRC